MVQNNCDDNFQVILKFLEENPNYRAGKNKEKKDEPPYYDEEYIKKTEKKFSNSRKKNSKFTFPESKTFPDQAVSSILGTVKGYDKPQLENIAKVHKESMTAENMVGNLLESYIESRIDKLGWIRCYGDIVKSVDFIKNENDGSISLLQIKNGKTTENSSSDKVRKGTNIKKWYRRNPNNNTYNWDNFPDEEAKKLLNEQDFQNFIKEKIKSSLK